MRDADRKQKIAELFIRLQQHREAAWKAHINRKAREALQGATQLHIAATDLVRLLAE